MESTTILGSLGPSYAYSRVPPALQASGNYAKDCSPQDVISCSVVKNAPLGTFKFLPIGAKIPEMQETTRYFPQA